ncbi:hypothetical protein ACFWNR_07010 [Streptomyces virginiae]|uniref:hypothetical protein n=1 Tax=Streptomyces virginiae TaxID=1961 RepID=UPI003657168C
MAWKLMWPAGDMHPQGKDLYDAVLPAEDRVLPYPLLEEVFRLSGKWEGGGGRQIPPTLDVFEDFTGTDWASFALEYPGLDIGGRRYEERLPAATFADGA